MSTTNDPNAVNSTVAAGILDQISRIAGAGNINSGITSNLWGLNNIGGGSNLFPNTDHYGMIFFTRPRLNLSYDNVIRDRLMSNLATTKFKSLPAALRHYLDPVGGASDYTSPLVDQHNAFIPLLSNLCQSSAGWPDPNIGVFNSTPGLYGESWGMIDSHPYTYQPWQMTCNFRNTNSNPILNMFQVWLRYAGLVYLGVIDPYLDALLENEVDYQTRIWRIVLDPTRTIVKGIACCGAAFPTSVPMGEKFAFNRDHPINPAFDEISINFQCYGAWYDDPILYTEFNQVVAIFNNGMSDANRAKQMIKVTPMQRQLYNYISYPHINLDTMELEWYINSPDADPVITKANAQGQIKLGSGLVTPQGTALSSLLNV